VVKGATVIAAPRRYRTLPAVVWIATVCPWVTAPESLANQWRWSATVRNHVDQSRNRGVNRSSPYAASPRAFVEYAPIRRARSSERTRRYQACR